MRRIVTILAGAALALALVGPAVAGATEKSSAGSTTFTAEHVRGGHGHEGHRDGGHFRHGYGRGGRCYGCFGPGSRCDRWGCGYAFPYFGYGYGYPYYYGGYYGGGFGCNFDYPCGPPYSDRTYDCSRYRGPDGQAAQNPQCRWNDRCQCYYHGSTPAPGSEKQGPPPSGSAPPAPAQGGQPGPDQGMQPGPDQGQQPPPAQGGEPKPY